MNEDQTTVIITEPDVQSINRSSLAGSFDNFFKALTSFGNTAAFAYSAIIALQLKVIWAIWQFKDLTPGDTIQYFYQAAQFYSRGKVAFAWSPMYTSFCGLLLNVSTDAWVNIILQRVVINISTAVLFLALTRRLLPSPIAWFITAWWVINPTDFNALYEVHQFAVIPVLCAWLVTLNSDKTIAKAGGAFVLWLCGALMRNEVTLGAALYTAICLGFDFSKLHPGGDFIHRLRPYLYMLAAVLAIVAFAYIRSPQKGAILVGNFREKHTVNVCQIYAFNYQQRHPEWKQSPWIDCYQLAKDTFGKSDLTMLDAVKSNPRAMFEYFLWNVHLMPNGLQNLLFNVAATSDSPDYVPGNVNFWQAVVPSVLLLALFGLGLSKSWRERRVIWESYARYRIWCFISMACVAVTSVIIMLMQRPRPCYIFSFGMTLMCLSGFCIWRLLRGTTIARLCNLVVVPLICFSIILTPSFYLQIPVNPLSPGSLFLADEYHVLKPFAELLASKGQNVFVLQSSGEALMYYIYGVNYSDVSFKFEELESLYPEIMSEPLSMVVAKHHLGWLLLDECLLRLPLFKEFAQGVAPPGWKLMAFKNVPNHRLMLYERMP